VHSGAKLSRVGIATVALLRTPLNEIRCESPPSTEYLVIGHQETRMTELEVIAKNILGLKQLLRVAWEDLGSTHLSLSERREIRSQMRRAAADLHHALQDFQDEHDRLRKLHAEKCEKEAPRRVKLRLVD